ncbi:YihY/virulence factor BrkB family protein [Halalkalicoccus ordinarius]|uniref:YihY/virulence factor BrkB family protein n=1 Tax=Halalkalicoccus ordinarius TaxID=3116651 RepID=UPI00300E82AB
MVDLSRTLQLGKQIGTEFSEKNVTLIAAGIAYNAFISLAPILLVLLLAVSLAGGGLEQRIVEVARTALPGPIAGIVVEIFQGESAVSGASVVGLVVLVWGALKIFRSLDTAFSEIYETTADNSFLDQVVDALVVLVAIVIAIVGTVGVTAVFAMLEDTIPFIGLLTPVVLVGGLVLAFFPMYYRFPDTDLHWRHVLPGVVVAAVGWAAFQSLFQVYLAATGGGSENFFGGVIVIVTWLYFSGLILLLGAIINAVLGGYASGDPGGVGRGAAESATTRETGDETTYEETLTREESAEFLEALREDLAGRYEGMRPTGSEKGADRRPQPDGDIEVIERTTSDGEGREWTISLRWRTPVDESAGRLDSADD